MSVFVDTSALFALLDKRDRYHAQATSTFQRLLAVDQLITHNYIHVEALALTTRRLGKTAAIALGDVLLPVITTIWVDEALHRAAWEAQRASARSASFVDRVSFALMRQLGIQAAFAFDEDFEGEGFERASVAVQGGRLSEDRAPYAESAEFTANGGGDLVSVSEIAARARTSVHTVQSWRRRHADFPAPLARLAAGPIWTWPAVQGWLESRSA